MTDVTPRKAIRKITPAIIWIAIGVILALILLFSSFFVVDQKEEAVVLNLGKFSRQVGTRVFISRSHSEWKRTTTCRRSGF